MQVKTILVVDKTEPMDTEPCQVPPTMEVEPVMIHALTEMRILMATFTTIVDTDRVVVQQTELAVLGT